MPLSTPSCSSCSRDGEPSVRLLLDARLGGVYPLSTLLPRRPAPAVGAAAPAAAAPAPTRLCACRFSGARAKLGAGKFGTVWRVAATCAPGSVAVVKAVPRAAVRAEGVLPQLRREIEIHARMRHANIIACYGYYIDTRDGADDLCLLLEEANGGSLYEALWARGGQLPEREAARLTQQIARCGERAGGRRRHS